MFFNGKSKNISLFFIDPPTTGSISLIILMLQLKFILSLLIFYFVKIETSRLEKFTFENEDVDAFDDQQDTSDDFSWFKRFILGFFSPDGLKALERTDRFGETKIYEIEIESKDFENQTKFYSKLNSIGLISDFEADDDDEEYSSILANSDKLIVNITNGFISYASFFDYQEILFKAAVSQSNLNRLMQLLAYKIDKKLTDQQRLQIFSDAIHIAVDAKIGQEKSLSIISFLLKYNFVNLSDFALLDCPLQKVFKSKKVAQTFLNQNSQFFSNLNNFNHVANEIYQRDFKAARVALECGADPEILYQGRNALDVALSITNYEPDLDQSFLTNIVPFSGKEEEDSLSYLIRTLRESGLTESMTFENYLHACNEKRIDLAHQILVSGLINPQEFYLPGNKLTSPLSKAFHSEDVDLIKFAADLFLIHLTTNQLQHARLECLSLLNEEQKFSETEAIFSELLEKIHLLLHK